MKDNICQTRFSAKEQLNNFPSNSAPAESQGKPLTLSAAVWTNHNTASLLTTIATLLPSFRSGPLEY